MRGDYNVWKKEKIELNNEELIILRYSLIDFRNNLLKQNTLLDTIYFFCFFMIQCLTLENTYKDCPFPDDFESVTMKHW